ncbi:MAG: hypothetical protein AAFR61_07960 [Bacteroidota bacterium]
MSFAFQLLDSPDLELDVESIFTFLSSLNTNLGSDFLVALEDTLKRMEARYQRDIPGIPQATIGPFFREEIKADKASPVSFRNFRKYYVWYIIDRELKVVRVLAIDHSAKDPLRLEKMLNQRLGK